MRKIFKSFITKNYVKYRSTKVPIFNYEKDYQLLNKFRTYLINSEYELIIEEYQILNSYYKRLKYKEFHEMAYYIINKEYESFRIQKFDYQINPIYVGKILFLLFGILLLILYKKDKIDFKSFDFNRIPEFDFYSLYPDTDNFELNFSKENNERLDNVKGIDEVKKEIEQIIRMIKNPTKYTDVGAELHKGILLCGKPGTGKTLMARAIAGEAGVNFVSLTGSDFDEMYVGVGAQRIKKLFKEAKANKPCIIFIDEIDSLLTSSRRNSLEHSSSRSTINQFLTEMDGFNKMEQIFLIGATNHENDLDKAAVRAGRFDKKIHINVPDEAGRVEIIKYYIEKINLDKDNLKPEHIAKMTPGFSGAEIENLVNLSIISAVSVGSKSVSEEDISEARDRILMGISRKYYKASDKRRYLTALHESGHTLVCYRNEICRRQLHKLTIIPRGSAEGVTFRLHDEDALNLKEEFLADIDMAMGGHVAEELMYGEYNMTAGCSSDLNKATQVAQAMVKKLGMYSDKVGYIYIEEKDKNEKVSEKYKSTIDDTVRVILKESHDRVYELLESDADGLKKLAQNVFQYDTLDFEDIENVLNNRPLNINKKIVRDRYSGEYS